MPILKLSPKQYADMVNAVKPSPAIWRNILAAFFVGGTICTIGQGLFLFYQSLGASKSDAGTLASLTLVFLSALLTGLGVYDEIGRFGGAGAVVPITGFANAMVAPAIEFRAEGLVLGVGARLFTVAGPVLVYGIVSAWLVGLIYLIGQQLR
ncbi:MAG: stage V sporulation protein AC [Bacillota bacterium]|uniref:stage V sporulation protein AC n=1 Tax=Desulfurispora thermophila TaxID=265470 RepID=UPI000381D889|nr:stage V sporulation protein AC [Desulfurispora thermophila]